MADPVTPLEPEASVPDSQLFGVSLRAWILVMALATVCTIELTRFCVLSYGAIHSTDPSLTQELAANAIKEPLYSIVLLCVGAYYGKRGTK